LAIERPLIAPVTIQRAELRKEIPVSTSPGTVADVMSLVVAFAEDLLGSPNHVAHLETSTVRAFGDGWRRDANGSDDAGLFQ
jgi:hypothetical protein